MRGDAELRRRELAVLNGGPGPSPPASRLRRLDVGRMIATPPPPVPWVVEPLLIRGELTLLAGREGLGKSLLALAVCVGVLTGESAGPFTTRRGRVLIIDGENGERELHRRVRALGLASVEGLEVYLTEAPDLLNDLGEIERTIAAERPDLVVVDALRTLWRGKENASEEVGPAIDALRNLARRLDVAILLLHHAGKVGDEYRGSTAIGAGAQVIVGMGREPDDEQPERLYLVNPKLRSAPRWPRKWIRLAVEFGAVVCLEEASPPGDEADAPPRAPARAEIGPQVAAVLDRATAPLTLAEVCRAVGRGPKDGTVRRVLDHLAEHGAAAREEAGWRRCQPHGAPKGTREGGTRPLHLLEPHGQGVPGGANEGASEGAQNGVGTPLGTPHRPRYGDEPGDGRWDS